eukprot:Awhi_evm1s3408
MTAFVNFYYYFFYALTQICPEKILQEDFEEVKNLDSQFASLIIPCLQHSEDLSVRFALKLLNQFTKYVDDDNNKDACPPYNNG